MLLVPDYVPLDLFFIECCLPQAGAVRAQSHTYNRRLQEMEPAALYHPNNPEVAGSPACVLGRRVQPPLPK